eukprot:6459143-Amphidinium_carterae.2
MPRFIVLPTYRHRSLVLTCHKAVDFQTEKSGGDADKTPENATPSSSSAEKRGASKTGATDSSVPRTTLGGGRLGLEVCFVLTRASYCCGFARKPGRNRKTTVEYELRVEVDESHALEKRMCLLQEVR